MILATWLTLCSTLLAGGQLRELVPAPRPDAAAQQPIQVSVQSASPPIPALKYQLLPEFGQQTPGNAAPQYLITLELFPAPDKSPDLLELIDAPQLDKDAARRALNGYENKFVLLRLASECENCEWNLPVRQQGINTLLPYLSRMIFASRAVALNARLQIADGKFDEAVDSLRIGFAMARHLCNQGGLVQGLAANGINRMMLERIAEMQQQPGAPNVYWALANLPRPLVDLSGIISMERSWMWFSFPELRGRLPAQLSADELTALFHHMYELQKSFNSFNNARNSGPSGDLTFATSMVGAYETAKRQLIAQGRTPEQVQAMPVQAVLAPYLLSDYLHWNDELFKWAGLPYWQAGGGLARSTELLQSQRSLLTNPLMLFTASLNRALLQFAAAERLAARIQLIEAVRAYAATHEGKLPATLEEMSETPAPLDPMSGKAFDYRVSANVASLQAPSVPGAPAEPAVQISVR